MHLYEQDKKDILIRKTSMINGVETRWRQLQLAGERTSIISKKDWRIHYNRKLGRIEKCMTMLSVWVGIDMRAEEKLKDVLETVKEFYEITGEIFNKV
jgi:hypothetical protein